MNNEEVKSNKKRNIIITVSVIVILVLVVIGYKTGLIIGFNTDYGYEKISMEEGTITVISDSIPSDAKLVSSDDDIVSIEDNKIIGKKEGKAVIKVIKDNKTVAEYEVAVEKPDTINDNKEQNTYYPSDNSEIPVDNTKSNNNEQNTTNNQTPNTNNNQTQSDRSNQTTTTPTSDKISYITITLDSVGANNSGTANIYEKVINGKSVSNYYLDKSLTKEMTKTTNKINNPSKNSYIFNGYYTNKNGSGDLVIDNNGYVVYKNTFSSNTTLYAHWISNTYVDNINQIRCNKDGTTSYKITTCQSTSTQNALCNYSEVNGVVKSGTVARNTLSKENCGYFTNPYTAKVVSASSNDICKELKDINDGCFISGNTTKNEAYMQHNTDLLQNIINKASEYGIKNNKISEIKIPAGEIYFVSSLNNNTYVSLLKNNIHISGAGENKTILKPYGYADKNRKVGNKFYLSKGLGMFFYNSSTDSVYLENVKFSSFTIDSSNTRGFEFYVSAKGFSIALCKNCHWSYVTIKNTDATCFGMDQLINSTIDHCTAIGCGKNAGVKSGKTSADPHDVAAAYGSSGFGIGFGKTNDEYVVISNSTAKNCAKFGFFFEDQNRFSSVSKKYNASKSKGFIIKNCSAEGNLINYGGIRAFDVVLYNSSSSKPRAYDVYFTEQSRRINISNINVNLDNGYSESRKFRDVNQNNFYYDAVKWAQSKGISIGYNEDIVLNTKYYNYSAFVDNVYLYSPDVEISRAEAILMLWRSENRPGEVITYANNNIAFTASNSGDKTNIKTGFSDVDPNASYAGAVKWGKEKGIINGTSSTQFSPASKIKKQHFLLMLYRLDNGTNNSGDEITNANNWAISKKIIDNANNLDNFITRKEAITMTYRYYKSTGFKYDTSSYISSIENSLKK